MNEPVQPMTTSQLLAKADARKIPYRSPLFQTFGRVSQLTLNVGTVNGDSGPLSMPTGSDRSMKESIVRIGTHPLGYGVYLFDFKPEFRARFGSGRQFGVMADEVEQVMPEAVSLHPDGYKRVDYAMLGILRHLQ